MILKKLNKEEFSEDRKKAIKEKECGEEEEKEEKGLLKWIEK